MTPRDKRYSSSTWRRLRQAVLDRDGWLCTIKGDGCEVVANEADHIVPVLDDGPFFDPSNVRAACSKCNSARRRWDRGRPSPSPRRYPGPSRVW